MDLSPGCGSSDNGAVRKPDWGRRATLHVGTFNHKPLDRPSKRRRFSEDLLQQNPVRPRPISGIAARCRAWTMRFHRNSTASKDEEFLGRWKTSPCASSLAINMSLLVGTSDVLSDIAERAFFTALQTNDVDEVSLAIDRFGHTLSSNRCVPDRGPVDLNRRDSLQTEILLRNCKQLLGKYEEGEEEISPHSEETEALYRNALHTAVYYESVDVVELLLSHGFDPNATGEVQSIPESSKERESVLRFIYPPSLSSCDMKKSMVDVFWITKPVVFLAAHTGNHEILKKLLAYGAPVHVTDENGNIPLHFAVSDLVRNIRCVSLLIENGSSLHHRNLDGKTPLDLSPELKHLYKRIVLDHLEPLSPDSVTMMSDDVILKRRMRSIGNAQANSASRKQSIGSLTLSKLGLKKGTHKGETKCSHKDENDADRHHDQKRLSVGRKMSFAFRNFFDKRKKSHPGDVNDMELGDSSQSGPKSFRCGTSSRPIGRRRCVSFNDKVDKYPHDFEQSIATLSLMASDHDCALMVARRLPRCWPRILTLATTLGSEVCQNTVTVLAAVKNMILNREHHEKRKTKTLEQPVSVLRLAMGILSSCRNADTLTLNEIVCKMMGYITDELAISCSAMRNRYHKKGAIVPTNEKEKVATPSDHSHATGHYPECKGMISSPSHPTSLEKRQLRRAVPSKIESLQCFGKRIGSRKPFCNECGISLQDIHQLRNTNVRNFQKRKCRLKLNSIRKFIGSCRTVLGPDMLLDCLVELRTYTHERKSSSLSARRTTPRCSSKTSSNIPIIERDSARAVNSGLSKSFKPSISTNATIYEVNGYDTEDIDSDVANDNTMTSRKHARRKEVEKTKFKMTTLLMAMLSESRYVTSSAVHTCLNKLKIFQMTPGEGRDWGFCLNILYILQVAFLHPSSSDLQSLDLKGSLLPILPRRNDRHSRKDGDQVILLEAFRLLVFSGNLAEAVNVTEYSCFQSLLSVPEAPNCEGKQRNQHLLPLCDFLLLLIGIDIKSTLPRFGDCSDGGSEWMMFFEIVPFVVQTSILLRGVQVYIRIVNLMVKASQDDKALVDREEIKNALHFVAEWLQQYPQDFLRDESTENASRALLGLLSEMNLSKHPTTLQLRSTTRRVKRGASVQSLYQKSSAMKKSVNRTISSPSQLQLSGSPARSLEGSERSLDRLSNSTPTKITRTLWRLLSLKPSSSSQSLEERYAIDKDYYLWQGRVTSGELQCDSETAAKLASLQMQIQASSVSGLSSNTGSLQETDLLSSDQPGSKILQGRFFPRLSLLRKSRNSEPDLLSTSQESLTGSKFGTTATTKSGRGLQRGRFNFRSYRRKGDKYLSSSWKSKSEDLPAASLDHCLPQEQRDNPRIHRLIQMHLKGREWSAPVEEGKVAALKLKYVSICEGLELDQMVTYPVKLLGKTYKKKAHLLHVSQTHISLLQVESKSPVERHPLSLIEDWHVAFEREAGGYPTLVVAFNDDVVSWKLLVSTPQQVKHICSALSTAMEEVQNNNNEGAPVTTATAVDPAAKETVTKVKQKKDKLKELLGQTPLASLSPEDRELQHCGRYLRFPVEAAYILTDAEYRLFQDVKSSSYVNYIRNNGLRLSETGTQEDVKTIHDLKDRCEKVTEWVVESVLDVSEEAQFTLLMQYVELANTCWNIGNFQGVVEILEAVLSDRLEEILQHADSDDITSLMQLHQCILEGDPDYQYALDKALRIPGCRVVPYFGVFLDQLVAVFEEPSPAVALSMLEMEREICEFDWWMKDGDMPTTSPGLLSTAKMSQAYWILEDLRFCKRMTRQNATLEDFTDTDSPTVMSGTYEKEDLAYHSCSEDFDDAESIEPLPKTHGLEIVPQQCMDADLNALHCMQRGTRVYRVDDEGSKYSECFLRLDESNAVLIWTKLQQKDLPVGSLTASLSILSSKYSTTNYIVGGLEEGFLDLTHAKELLPESEEIDCTHISHSTDYELYPFAIMYGTSIVENKRLYFLAPRNTRAIWKAGLDPIIKVIRTQQRVLSDKRSKWLMKQFLNAFFFKGNLGGPTALEAIQMFGGKNATFSKVKDQANENEGPTVFQPEAKLALRKRKEEKSNKRESVITTGSHPKVEATGQSQTIPKPKKKIKKIGLKKLKKGKKSKKKEESLLVDAEVTTEDPDQESDSDDDESDDDSDRGSEEVERDEYQTSSGFEGSEFTGEGEPPTKEGEPPTKEGETKEKAAKAMSFYSKLTFPEFAQLFQAFSIRTRKDLKDIFERDSYKLPNIPTRDGDQLTPSVGGEKPGVPHVTRNILTNTVQTEVAKVLDILATSSITNNSAGPPQTMNIHVMGAEELQSFLQEIQGEDLTVPEVTCLIRRHEPNPDLRANELLSFEGFVRLLMDKENYAFNYEETNTEPLTCPLSHYYCKSSHNTYLTGHQLRGESSVELYAQVLLTGCRCVELDCWDGDDGWPIIYHGHTLTTKISFKEVCEAINKAAFITTPYPVILSIENHCSMSQQTRMAAIFQEVFGDKLVKNFMFDPDMEEDAYLPSPESLKGKIIIKNKKIKTKEDREAKLKASKTSSGLQNGEISDEEDDYYLFEDAYEDLSSAEDNTSLSVESRKFAAPSENSLEEQLSEKSAIGKWKHKRNASGSQSLVAIQAAAEEVHKKKKKKEPIIAPELSELINYCQSVKFPGFDDPEEEEGKKKKTKKGGELDEEQDEDDGGKVSKGKKTKKGEGDDDSDSKKKKKDKKKGTVEQEAPETFEAAEEGDSDSKSKKKNKDKDKKKKNKKDEEDSERMADGEDSDSKKKKKDKSEDPDEKKRRKKEEKERKKLEKKLKKSGKDVKEIEEEDGKPQEHGDGLPTEQNGTVMASGESGAGDALANGSIERHQGEETAEQVKGQEESESEDEDEREDPAKEGEEETSKERDADTQSLNEGVSSAADESQFVRGDPERDAEEDSDGKKKGIRLSFRRKDKDKVVDEEGDAGGEDDDGKAKKKSKKEKEEKKRKKKEEKEKKKKDKKKKSGKDVDDLEELAEGGAQEGEDGPESGEEDVVNGHGNLDRDEDIKQEEESEESEDETGEDPEGGESKGVGESAQQSIDSQTEDTSQGDPGESSEVKEADGEFQKMPENGDNMGTVKRMPENGDIAETGESEMQLGDENRKIDSDVSGSAQNGVEIPSEEKQDSAEVEEVSGNIPETPENGEPEGVEPDAGSEVLVKDGDRGADEEADTEDDITASITTNGARDDDLERVEDITEDPRVVEVEVSEEGRDEDTPKGVQNGPSEEESVLGTVEEDEVKEEEEEGAQDDDDDEDDLGETASGTLMSKKERKEAKKLEKAARKVEKENKKAELQRETSGKGSKKWKRATSVITIVDEFQTTRELRIKPPKSRTKACHISSLNESHLKKMFRKFGAKFVQHCEFQLIRTYPAGMRIDSSNYNPLLYWACGIQLVALNYQREDLPMHLQMAQFEQNGSCGYVLKPEFMRNESHPLFTRFDAFAKVIPGFKVKELTIEVVSGQYLNTSNPTGSCFVELELIGLPCDCNKLKTKPVSKNMTNPVWNEEFSFRIAFEELAFIRFAVVDNNSSNVIAQRIIPVGCLRKGYRHVRMRSSQNVPLELTTLFILNRLTEVQDDEIENAIQKKEQLTHLVYYYVGRGLADDVSQSVAEASSVGVYGIDSPDVETLLWTTGDTKAGELLAEAVGRAGKPLDDLENYALEEEAVLNFRQGDEVVQREERILDSEENVHEVQAAWNGEGRFLLKLGENATPASSVPGQTFLISVHTRSVSDVETMSFEISASATTPDIIARVLAKAGRLDVDPEQYCLNEEKSKDGKNLNLEATRKSADKIIQRLIGDEEKLWDIQTHWIESGINGRFSVRDKNEEKSLSTSKLRRVTSLRQRKQKIMQSAAVQAKKVSITGEIPEGVVKPESKARKVSRLKIWKSS